MKKPSRNLCIASFATMVAVTFSMAQQTVDPFSPEYEAKPQVKQNAEFPVKMTIKAGNRAVDSKQRIVVTLDIQDSYYVHANPSGNDDLVALELVGKISQKEKPAVAKFVYPKGEMIVDKIVGNYFIYRGKLDIEIVVGRPKDDTEPITVSFLVRPFDARGCLWGPRRLTQELP